MLSMRRISAAALGAVALLALASFRAGAYGPRETGAIRDVRGFDSVSLDTSGELIITQGDQEALEIVARESDLPNITTQVSGGTLAIGRRGSGPLFPFSQPVFRLTMKKVAALRTHSSGKITVNGLRAGSLRLQISSSGGITIDGLEAGALDVQLSSSGSLRVAGRVERQEVRISSSGSYLAGDLESRSASVRVSSSGSATVRVSESLEANLSSSGGVRYYGNPPRVQANVTSSGRLVRLGG